MESEQTSVLRPLILVAEDDDSNFKLIKAIIGKNVISNGRRTAKKWCSCFKNTNIERVPY